MYCDVRDSNEILSGMRLPYAQLGNSTLWIVLIFDRLAEIAIIEASD